MTPAYRMLYWTYGLVPIVAGLDKFTNLLVDWTSYVSPLMAGLLPMEAGTFMMIVGVIEIAAGVVVLAKPRLGSAVVAAWLVLISLNLLMAGRYDVAVRDLVMAVGAVALSTLVPPKAS